MYAFRLLYFRLLAVEHPHLNLFFEFVSSFFLFFVANELENWALPVWAAPRNPFIYYKFHIISWLQQLSMSWMVVTQ